MQKEYFNELPRPTFRWMKVNHLELDAEPAAALKPVELSTRQEGKAEVKAYAGNQLPDLGDYQGSSKESLAEALAGGNVNCSITVPAGEKVSVWLHYEVTEENPRLVGQLKIDAQKGSELHVFELFDGDAEGGYVNLLQYIEAEEDAVKVDNDDDTSAGTMYLSDNTMTIKAGDDGIHASGDMIIDSGTYKIEKSTEGIEGKSVTINGGNIDVYATDDGVNAANSNASQSEIFFKMTGGTLNVEVGQGDTDPIDSNGDIIVSGGTINLTGQSGFDFDGSATYTGGDITINGEKQTKIENSMPGGGGPQGGGQPGGFGGGH